MDGTPDLWLAGEARLMVRYVATGKDCIMDNGKISFNCPGCGREFNVDARLKGRKIRCSQCKRLSPIPSSQVKKRIITRPATASAPQASDAIPASARQPDPPPEPKPTPEPAPEPDVAAEAEPESGSANAEPPPKQPATGKPLRIRIKPAHSKTAAPADAETVAPPSGAEQESSPPAPSPPETEAIRPSETEEPTATAPADDDPADPGKQLQQTRQALAEMTARREREEASASRTIAEITTQCDEAIQQRDQMAAELNALRQQKQQWENETNRHQNQTKAILRAAKQAVDQYCETQLNSMQTLRRTLKRLSGDEA